LSSRAGERVPHSDLADVPLNFGECLKDLLIRRRHSAAKLARGIQVERSLPQKWVRGERLPGPEYLGPIGHALALSDSESRDLTEAWKYSALNRSITRYLSASSAETRVMADLLWASRTADEGLPVGLRYTSDFRSDLLLNELFETLIGEDASDGRGSVDYFHGVYPRFWRRDFYSILAELSIGEAFIYTHRLQGERRGRLWLAAFSALKAIMFTHALPRKVLDQNPRFGVNELEKCAHLDLPSSSVWGYALSGWGSLIQQGAKRNGRYDEALLAMSLQCQKRALDEMDADDPPAIIALGEAMSATADLEIAFPDPPTNTEVSGYTSLDYFEQAIRRTQQVGPTAARYGVALRGYEAKFALRKVKREIDEGKLSAVSLEQFSDLEQRIVATQDEARRFDGTVAVTETELAVTRANLYQVSGEPIPRQVRREVLKFLTHTYDPEQIERWELGQP